MQKKVEDFNQKMPYRDEKMAIYARLLDMESEMGELAKEYLKATNYGTKGFELDDEFRLEYGDLLYCLLSLANEVGIDAEECLDKVIAKYQKRIDDKNDMGSGR